MRTFKSVLAVMGALFPVLYCSTLIYYFLDISGSLRGAKTIGLSPTLLGLTVVGLLFCIPLVLKFMRIFARPASPESSQDGSARDDENGFDADAAIARYMEHRSVKIVPASPASAFKGRGPVKRAGFGRRAR